eukprot:6473459-Amphidinium_carterae.1
MIHGNWDAVSDYGHAMRPGLPQTQRFITAWTLGLSKRDSLRYTSKDGNTYGEPALARLDERKAGDDRGWIDLFGDSGE